MSRVCPAAPALPKKDWEDFGSPETITVTVVAGDILNTKES